MTTSDARNTVDDINRQMKAIHWCPGASCPQCYPNGTADENPYSLSEQPSLYIIFGSAYSMGYKAALTRSSAPADAAVALLDAWYAMSEQLPKDLWGPMDALSKAVGWKPLHECSDISRPSGAD